MAILAVEGPLPEPCILTEAQLRIVHLSARGYENKEIAKILWLSPNTVKTHLYKMYLKTGTRNRAHLVYVATKNRWIR